MTATFTRHIWPIIHFHVLRNKFQSPASCKLNRCSPHDANYSVIFQKLFRVGPPLFMRERTLSLMKTDYNSGVMETRGDFSILLVGLHGPQSCYSALANDHTVISLLTPPVTLAQHRGAATATVHILSRAGHRTRDVVIGKAHTSLLHRKDSKSRKVNSLRSQRK